MHTSIQQIIPEVYRLKMSPYLTPGMEPSNVYFVGDSEIIIIDAGYPTDEARDSIIKAWSDLGRPEVKSFLITHVHIDHAGSLDVIKSEIDAPVCIHRLEAGRFDMMFPVEHEFRTIDEGDIISIKGHNVKAMHMPGHTAGHLCFYDESNGILFSGDMIIGSDFAVIVPPDGDMREYMKSLYRAKTLPVKIILPGHGSPVYNPYEKIEEYIHHRSMRRLQLIKLLEDFPRAIPDLAEEIYADLMPGLRITGRLQIMAHLTDMEKDGLVEHVSGDGTDAVYRSLAGIA